MSDLLIYALCVYAVFHFLTRSDMMRRPREWVLARSPRGVRYVSTCAFCFTAWVAIALMAVHLMLTGELRIVPAALMAAPVINLVLDLIVTALRRANEPPVIQVTASPSTTTTGSVLATVTAVSDIRAGQLVAMTDVEGVYAVDGDGCQIPESTRYAHLPGGRPVGWEQTNCDDSLYRITGIVRWWPGQLVGRKVRVATGPHSGQTGTIDNGSGPSIFGAGNDAPWTYLIKPDSPAYRRPGDPTDGRIRVDASDCTFLDGPDAPFNPLDHEQTK